MFILESLYSVLSCTSILMSLFMEVKPVTATKLFAGVEFIKAFFHVRNEIGDL